jgi:hypothetical protein
MSGAVLLNNVDHAELRVVTRHSAAFGDNINQVLVFPTEFEDIQREYPILFTRDANGMFQAVALLGLDRDENLFLDESRGWQARYVPAARQTGPFVIGMGGSEPMIRIDPAHPRVSNDEGEPLFLRHGGNSPYLEYTAGVLRTIYTGIELMQPMFDAFEQEGLIVPVELGVQVNEERHYTLADHHIISAERLGALGGDALERLHRAGFLYPAFLIVASMDNMNRLIALKNARLAAA